MENVLISTCLLGVNTRYDGGSILIKNLDLLKEKYHLIPVCCEQFGGMTTPRLPSEILGDKVVASDLTDVTEYFQKGVTEVLKIAEIFQCKIAILKESSPSCGSNMIYDGSFTGKKIAGMGVVAKALWEKGIKIYSENTFEELL